MLWTQIAEFFAVMIFIRAVRESSARIFIVLLNSSAVIALLFAYLIFFSMLGFTLFNDQGFEDESNAFETMPSTIFNVFILLTDSNFPDILFPYWRISIFSAFYFVGFLCIGMFMLLNLLLAVFYNSYKHIVEDKLSQFED
jgi:cytochrome bd-type quinol oxidase subunit 2